MQPDSVLTDNPRHQQETLDARRSQTEAEIRAGAPLLPRAELRAPG